MISALQGLSLVRFDFGSTRSRRPAHVYNPKKPRARNYYESHPLNSARTLCGYPVYTSDIDATEGPYCEMCLRVLAGEIPPQ